MQICNEYICNEYKMNAYRYVIKTMYKSLVTKNSQFWKV